MMNCDLPINWPGQSEAPPCLLMDAGNTQVKAMLVDGANKALVWQCPRAQWVQANGLEQVLVDCLASYPQVRHFAISSVLGPQVHERLLAWCAQRGLSVFVAAANQHPQLHTCYTQPKQLGQDRWCAALAVALCSTKPANVVLCLGTAATLDAVVRQPVSWVASSSAAPCLHLGGYIAPGPATMLEALAKHTAQLPALPQSAWTHGNGTPSDWPTDTQQAMAAAAVSMPQHWMWGMAQGLSQSLGGVDVQCWVLGGHAQHPAFASWLANAGVVHWPEAVFYGLYAAWQHQYQQGK